MDDEFLSRFENALRRRGDLAKTLRDQMDEATRNMIITSFWELPDWKDYATSQETIRNLESEWLAHIQ